MRLFRKGINLSKVAKAIDGLNLMIKDLVPKIQNNSEYSEFRDEVLVLAYIARKNVIDLIEENNWSMDIKIMVSTFNKRRIPLVQGYSETVDKIEILANHIGFYDIVREVLEKGNAYYELENQIPKEVLRLIK